MTWPPGLSGDQVAEACRVIYEWEEGDIYGHTEVDLILALWPILRCSGNDSSNAVAKGR